MPVPRANARIRVQVVHEDANTLVVNKMPGVVTEPGRSHRDDSLLNGILAHDAGRLARQLIQLGEARDWGLLHRLDRLTSGLVLMALDADAWTALRGDFEARRVQKTYLAVVRGDLDSEAGEISLPLIERIDAGYRVSVIDPNGKPALTRFRVRQRSGRYALVECDLVTGRLHQIRVHLASIGVIVAGDPIYDIGGRAKPNAGRAKDPQLHLHAWRLSFLHPSRQPELGSPSDRVVMNLIGEPPRRFTEFAEAHGLHVPAAGA
jgi:23S rRNA pseudouridine1911/1915/1917 synthase